MAKNKHTWCYKFLYWPRYNKDKVTLFTVDTDLGLGYAENVSLVNATFDGCHGFKYLGRSKVK
jgi:hypothetical protein